MHGHMNIKLENTPSIQKQPIRHIANQKGMLYQLQPTEKHTQETHTHIKVWLFKGTECTSTSGHVKDPPYQKLRNINCEMRPIGLNWKQVALILFALYSL